MTTASLTLRPFSGLSLLFSSRRPSRRDLAALRALDNRLLDDVGLSRDQLYGTAKTATLRPNWDAPSHWLR